MPVSQQSRRRVFPIFPCAIVTTAFFVIALYNSKHVKVMLLKQPLQVDKGEMVEVQESIVSLSQLLSGTGEEGDRFMKEIATSVQNAKEATIPISKGLESSSGVQTAVTSNNSSISGVPLNTTNLEWKEVCSTKYARRSFYPVGEARLPPMLYTFPGSGNTWCRLLIEYGLGIYSGSVYNDRSLIEALPGELTCNRRVSVIKVIINTTHHRLLTVHIKGLVLTENYFNLKVHPHTHPFDGLKKGNIGFHSDGQLKCNKGNVKHFERAILLIRSPFESIWSEFQRRVSDSHVGGIERAVFDWPRWQANAAALSHDYFTMWNVHYSGIEKTYAPSDVLFVRYEDFKNGKTRVQEMIKIAKFLGVTVSQERLECAFEKASQSGTHRLKKNPNAMSMETAYTKPLVCKMWALFGRYAGAHGYGVINNYDCSSYTQKDSIKNVVIGSLGEYDQSWVPVGEKLVDYGGHDEIVTVAAAPAAPVVKPATVPENGATVLTTADSAFVDAMNQKIKKRARRDARNKVAGKIAEDHSDAGSKFLGTPEEAGTAGSGRIVRFKV